ncbi:hypothetical protein B4U79_13400 [Dinothrombium tinctorium]|uniref:Very-long-chain (3R)-3-hydroxyacyl-CoA dehydratase n=1 Tax=Dinothrombium tinctorium TaxID=1965070 RepID=A0A443RAW2_9ACAR|nr:hypothetical protein B4U79_13400 [Dinothrombium tinctorium]
MVTERKGALNIYLLLYNAVQFVGWSYILSIFALYLQESGTYIGVWPYIATPLKIFQTLAMLEIINSALGFVPSPLFTTAMQILARNFFVWLVLSQYPETHSNIGLPMILISWTFSEIPRYLYYALNVLKLSPYFVTWSRYSFFIVTQPLGVLGEMILICSLLLKQKRDLLNPLNYTIIEYIMILSMLSSFYGLSPQ